VVWFSCFVFFFFNTFLYSRLFPIDDPDAQIDFKDKERLGRAQSLFKLDSHNARGRNPGAVQGLILLDIRKTRLWLTSVIIQDPKIKKV
jgi:hypothetical protein